MFSFDGLVTVLLRLLVRNGLHLKGGLASVLTLVTLDEAAAKQHVFDLGRAVGGTVDDLGVNVFFRDPDARPTPLPVRAFLAVDDTEGTDFRCVFG